MPRDSPVPDDESRGSSGSWDNNIYDPEIPNVTHWTVDQIIEYFDEKGFKSFSDVFREQVSFSVCLKSGFRLKEG